MVDPARIKPGGKISRNEGENGYVPCGEFGDRRESGDSTNSHVRSARLLTGPAGYPAGFLHQKMHL